jgi:hypothetical protein
VAFHAGDIEATLDLDRSPFNTGMSMARADAKKFEEHKIKATLDVDRSRLDKQLAAPGQSSAIKVPVDVDVKRLNEQLERIGDNTETTARRSGSRIARALLNPVVIQLGLLPGIAAASAALAGVALAALPLAFGAIAGAALSSNEEVKSTYKQMWEDIKDQTKEASKVLQPYALEVAREVRMSFATIKPGLDAIFSSIGPQVLDLTQGLTGLFTQAMPGFERAVRQSGPAVRGFEVLLKQTGLGVGQFFAQVSNRSADVGHGMELLGAILQTTLNNLGRLAATFSTAWSAIGPQFSRVFDKILDSINNLVSGGMPAFTTSLKVTLGVLEAILNILGPFADILGGSAGWLLGAAASWKILAGSVGLFSKAINLINPANFAGKFGGFSKAVESASQTTGAFITRVSGMPIAGAQFTNAMSKIGTAVTSSLKYIPLVGAAVAGVEATLQHFFPSADSLATSMIQGGKAADEARTKIYNVAGGYSKWNVAAGVFGSNMKEVNAAVQKHKASITEVERAQEDVTKAQNDYQYAIDKYGRSSKEATDAQRTLATATKAVENAQLAAAAATQTNIDKIIAQTNLILGSVGARLNYQASLLSLEQAQKSAAEATKDHGVKSLEARQANVAYQQQLLTVVQALGARVKAENANKSETEQNRLATLAMHQEIARLAVIAGKDAPVALQQLAAGLSDAELAALGVHKEIDKTGTAIYTLPPGKTLSFPNDAPVATSQVDVLHAAIDNLPKSKNFNYVLNVVTGQNPGIGQSSLGGLLGIPGRAEGGPVRRNMAYWVGEAGQPELFFPSVDGFILNGQQSEKVAGTTAGSGATPAVLGGSDGPDLEQFLELLTQAMVAALAGSRLRVEGPEWARLVNSANLANVRR